MLRIKLIWRLLVLLLSRHLLVVQLFFVELIRKVVSSLLGSYERVAGIWLFATIRPTKFSFNLVFKRWHLH